VGFLPGVAGADAFAQYWLHQATLRLRREVCWLWRERTQAAPDAVATAGALPPLADRGVAALDHARYDAERRSFFQADVTARYLSDLIVAAPPDASSGSFAALATRLKLAPVDCFVLALALLPCVDSAAGAVIGTCLNDASRCEPTLALAQRLWDEPDELLRCFDPGHALVRHGVLTLPAGGASGWQRPLEVPPLVARQLWASPSALPAALEAVPPDPADERAGHLATSFTPLGSTPGRLRIFPLIGATGAPLSAAAAACAARAGLHLVRPAAALERDQLPQLMTTAWLGGHALFVDASWLQPGSGHEAASEGPPLPGLPLWLFVGCDDATAARRLGRAAEPPHVLPPPTYEQRLSAWRAALPAAAGSPLLAEAARRFRFEPSAIRRIGATLAPLGRAPIPAELFDAARADLDLGTLAQPVTPRFRLAELMLSPASTCQVEEIVSAMHNLTRVHYEWGTAKAWSEGGLAVLFTGAPGTGKTMCAEAIAAELALPMVRIDLSQVVDKYIGQTEKNLRQLFDASDAADTILFFDEADALFGRRTEVKDAHDRYANLEVSYLLERMERFKGLAILATNRRKDLDEAFARRLRFVVEFALPGPAERLRIWRSVIPAAVDASALDLDFLAQRFALSGGHIRAIVFQACLQSADEDAPKQLTMPAVIRAVQREYDKLERAHSLNQFGPYAPLVAAQKTGA
jgi:vesicle-fusing ATPase